jgi:flagellar hook assembly protein FlgD
VDLSFSTGVPGIARLDVYDLAGRHVRALREGFAGPGEQRVVWDGRDDAGRSVATGVYFVRARGQGLDARARVLRLR